MTDTSTLKKSLLMIQKLKKLLKEKNEQMADPIAITGMSCRLPQANNPHEFWQLLCQGKNIISPIADDRWELLNNTSEPLRREANLPYWGGYLNNITEFDAYFFGISPREALRMDPQQRLLMEVCYESIEDAGLTLNDLAGSRTGVFSSVYASQFSHLQRLDSDMDALLIPTGSAISMAANRLSYLFDLRGPSMVLDTACSSSLIALQLACLNLQARLCDTALVSAVNINLLPSIHSMLSKATMLSPSGQCHTFDARADGYVQGEGAGCIVLKPLSRALKDKDRIYAVISGSAVNQDGKTNGLTAPNGLQQEQLLRAAYRSANIDPAEVSYIECHGTGTFLGDPIEFQALAEVLGKHRDPQKPCWISSVKTNVGHLEPAAGIISIIKTALVLKNGIIPPHLNFECANPHIPFEKYALSIPCESKSLPRYGDCAIAGVSGFGFGGANAHIVLRELNAAEQIETKPDSIKKQELFTLSAKSEAALMALMDRWQAFITQHPQISLAQMCHNLHLRRNHFPYRLAIITESLSDLQQKLIEIQSNPKAHNNCAIFFKAGATKPTQPVTINECHTLALSDLAEHYVNHAVIDWHQYETGRCYAHMDMPLYPWQHKRYWPELGQAQSEKSIQNGKPMQGKMLASPLSAQQFEFSFDTRTMPEIHDTYCVLHAGYYMEMLANAVDQMQQDPHFHITNLSFISPLLVPDGKTVPVQLILERNKDKELSFQFYSNDGQNNWILHAKGHLLLSTSKQASIDCNETIKNRTSHSGTSDSFYQRISAMGMPAGDSIRWIDNYWFNHQEIICQLRQPKASDRSEQFTLRMHPGIIDSCIQTLFLLLPETLTKPYIASHMASIECYGRLHDARYIYTVLKVQKPEGQHIIADWYLLDSKQQLIAHCNDLCMTQLNDTLNIDTIMAIQSEFQLDYSLDYQTCKDQLIQYLIEQFSHIFSMPKEDIRTDHSLHELGMDSLMALAVMRILETNLQISYSLPMMMKGPSIDELAKQILSDKLQGKTEEIPADKASLNHNRWISHRTIQTNAKMRLFCFPYGGGGASLYREWQQQMPDSIEICPIQLPGRENRMDEAPLKDIHQLVSLLATELKPLLNMPFALFGHSFGSLIAFELSRYLRRHHLPEPIQLFASAYPAPQNPSGSLDNLLASLKQMDIDLFDINQDLVHQMTDEQLAALTLVFKDNGIVDYNDERMNKNIVKVLLPIFIGDMNIVKSYQYQDESPLDLPITVFLGKQDTWVSPEEHSGWTQHSSLHCNFKQFNSGHLFIREKEFQTKLIAEIAKNLNQYKEIECEA